MLSFNFRTGPFVVLVALAVAAASCGKGEDRANRRAVETQAGQASDNSALKAAKPCLNLNAATAQELMTLPGIGEVIAKRVIDYREGHGRFRRPEQIIIIEGFSEKKYRAIAGSICVD